MEPVNLSESTIFLTDAVKIFSRSCQNLIFHIEVNQSRQFQKNVKY